MSICKKHDWQIIPNTITDMKNNHPEGAQGSELLYHDSAPLSGAHLSPT